MKPEQTGDKEPEETKALAERQELFCRYFASDREFFGNGVQSYAEAYDIDLTKKGGYNTAKVNAHRLLTKANILKRIDELFESRGLNDQFVDKQLEKLITQDAEYAAKIAAIKEYNALKSRITNKLDLTSKGRQIGATIKFEENPTPED
jgi:hypothetical protein